MKRYHLLIVIFRLSKYLYILISYLKSTFMKTLILLLFLGCADRSGADDSSSQPLLSTFGSRSSSQATPTSELLNSGSQGLLSTKSTVVQLRRNTNKMGRQAPTPPKRTR